MKIADKELDSSWRTPESQYLIGERYYYVEEDSVEAFKWYLISANQGFMQSQYQLGTMYLNGEGVDIDKYHITTKDQVLEDGKKYRRDINFWDDSIDLNNYKTNGMHIAGKDERIIPQLRIYSSMDGRWGQQIMWSSVYVVCLNGMVRPDWTFVVYNKHNKRKDITWGIEDFKSGLVAHKELGEDLFKMMQKKVKHELFKSFITLDFV